MSSSHTPATVHPAHVDFPCMDCKVRDRSLCSVLNSDELVKFNQLAAEVALESGQPIFFEEDEATFLFNITEGVVQLSRLLPDGRRQVTGFLFPGDFLGLSKDGCYAYTAETVAPVKLCRFNRPQMMKMFVEYPKLEARLLDKRSNELIEAQEHIILLGRKSASERVATLLLTFARKMGLESGQMAEGDDGLHAEEISLPVTRESMADYLGMRLETVSRVLSDFRKRGLIALPSPHRIRFVDFAMLEETAAGLDRE